VTDKKYRLVDVKRASKAFVEVSKFYQDEAELIEFPSTASL